MNLTLADLGFSSVRDKVVLVSDGSAGIGRASVKLLARADARTIAMARSQQKLTELRRKSSTLGIWNR